MPSAWSLCPICSACGSGNSGTGWHIDCDADRFYSFFAEYRRLWKSQNFNYFHSWISSLGSPINSEWNIWWTPSACLPFWSANLAVGCRHTRFLCFTQNLPSFRIAGLCSLDRMAGVSIPVIIFLEQCRISVYHWCRFSRCGLWS